MNEPAQTMLADLVCVRMLAVKDGSATPAQLRKDLETFYAHRWRGAEWTGVLERALDALLQDGSLVRTSRRVALSEAGRKRARSFLGLPASHRALRWVSVRDGLLVARALGLHGAAPETLRWIATAGGLRAALLLRQLGLPLRGTPTKNQAEAAAGWALLERGAAAEVIARVPRKEKFDAGPVLGALLATHLGLAGTPDKNKALGVAVAQAAGAARDDVKQLREALLRRLADGAPAAPQAAAAAPAAPAAAAPAPPAAMDLPTFAAQVLDAARSSPTGHFGEDRVLIAHVWRQFQREHPGSGLDEASFKQRLLEANRERQISLVCADMAPMLDPADVEASAIRYLSATFHLLCL